MSIKTQIRKIILTTLILIPSLANAVPGDFDADGRSDLSVALVNRGLQSTAWLTRLSNGATPLFWTFNVPADALVSMRFHTGDPRFYPGVIYVRNANSPLEWYVKNGLNNNVGFTWGLPGDIIPNQGDFDCDGREDPTVVRNQGGVLHWYTYRTATNSVSHVTFGVAGDQPYVSDTKGDCTADIVVLRNNFFWFVRDPGSEAFTAVQWGANGDIPLLPSDIDGDKLTDYVISRPSDHPNGGVVAGSQSAYILHGNGKFQVVNLGFDSSIPQINKFAGGSISSFAWSQRDTGWTAIRNDDGSPNVFQLGIRDNAIVRADGTVVQPTSNGRFPVTTTAPTPVPDSPVSTVGCTPSPGTASNFVDGAGGGALWKPVSEGVPNEASVFLLPISYCGANTEVLGSNGQSVSGIQRTKCGGNGNRAHFWVSRTASQMAASAPLTVRISRGGTTECRVVPDPRRRYD